VSLDHARGVGVLVPGEDEEPPRIVAHRLVLAVRNLERRRAVVTAALADEPDQKCIVFAVAGQADRDFLHALVDFAEERLVVRPTVFSRIHSSVISLPVTAETRAGFLRRGAGHSRRVERSRARAAENEAVFRQANETLEEKAAELALGQERTPYLCECENERCTQVVQLTRQEYEGIRGDPRRFVMVSGHQSTGDRVLREERGFTVIEKTGEEGDLVAEQNPR
jgi:hypothetical protein